MSLGGLAKDQGGPDSNIMIDICEGQSEGGGGPEMALGPGVWDPCPNPSNYSLSSPILLQTVATTYSLTPFSNKLLYFTVTLLFPVPLDS